MKLYTLSVPMEAAPQSLLSYVRRALPEVPEYALREAFRKRDVKVDGQRVGMGALLSPGTEVRLYVRETAAKPPIAIQYEDANVLIAVKPAGISCEPDRRGEPTLPDVLRRQLLMRGEDVQLLLCHRLDNPTDGLIVLAKSECAQRELQQAFRDRRVHKRYTCVVRGTPNPPHATRTAYLLKDAEHARVRILNHPASDARTIVTEYQTLEAGERARLLITLHTGRTHQIRAHMAFLGHPLLGDDLYGDRAFNREQRARRLMLCATELTFELQGELSYLNERRFAIPAPF